jgi:hypothetical protein
LNTKNQVSLIKNSDKLWPIFKNRLQDIKNYLTGKDIPQDINELLFFSYGLVMGELSTNKEFYDNYPPKRFTDEEFVDLVIESMSHFDIKVKQKEESYIEDLRQIAWGYVKSYHEGMSKLLNKCGKKDYFFTKKDVELFVISLATVYIECVIRNQEEQSLEKSYE